MISNKEKFTYVAAITRNLANSLAEEALRMEDSNVDIQVAKNQHEYYKKVLSENGIKVINLDADESLPDCVFTEDPLVVVGNRAMLTTLGHPARRGEKKAIKEALEKIPGMEIYDMNLLNSEALLDGGDVLYTGSEMFIGLTKRTNSAAIQVMQNCFKELKVHAIPVSDGLHLKSCMSMAGPETVICSTFNQGTQSIIQKVKDAATCKYNFVEMNSNPKKANMVYFKNSSGKSILLHPKMTSEVEKQALNSIDASKKIQVDTSELGKVDGCLTCCSVLLAVGA